MNDTPTMASLIVVALSMFACVETEDTGGASECQSQVVDCPVGTIECDPDSWLEGCDLTVVGQGACAEEYYCMLEES
jgi:hypothetical protein